MIESSTEPESRANPMVVYLTSLRTQERDANPSYVYENRAVFLSQLREGAPWFPSEEALHVATQLDGLTELLISSDSWPKIVLLTGDAGDGKTAFCARLARALGREDELEPVTELGAWTIVKDASEVVPEKRLIDLIEATEGAPEKRLIVAINEGRLRRLAHQLRATRADLCDGVIAPSLETWLDESHARELDEGMERHRWLVLNFRHRFHLRKAAPALLDAWTRPELWEDGPGCGSCPARERCPILANVQDLRGDAVRERVCDALASVHFAGQRLPLRRLQAVLALSCTGGLKCEDVQTGALADEVNEVERLRYRFYDVLFTRGTIASPVRVEPEQLCRALTPFDPGRDANRALDESVALAVVSDTDEAAGELPRLEQAALRRLRAVSRAAEGDGAELTPMTATLTRHLRRHSAFVAPNDAPPPTWKRALDLLERYAETGDSAELEPALLRGLNALHRRADKADSLVRRQLDPGGFRNPARLALELDLGVSFQARVTRGPILPPRSVGPWLESCPSELYLEAFDPARPTRPVRLHLDARLVSALLSACGGFVQLGVLGSYRRDLARFFGQLLRLASELSPGPRVILQRDGRKRELHFDEGTQKLVLREDA